jgi:hypothetical protein
MSTFKPIAVLVSLTATLLSACDPLATLERPLDPATDLCADLGEDQCRRPKPDDLTAN